MKQDLAHLKLWEYHRFIKNVLQKWNLWVVCIINNNKNNKCLHRRGQF